MKKIEFTNYFFKQKSLNVNNNISVIIGDHNSGKTNILNTLEMGFRGKLSEFFVDYKPVAAGDYQVIYFDVNLNIKDNLKFNKTSLLRKYFLIKLNNRKYNNKTYQKLEAKISEIENEMNIFLEDKFTNKICSLINKNIILKSNLTFSLDNLLDKFLKLEIFDKETENNINKENYNNFIIRTILFKILESSLEKDDARPIIILIDLPELYGSPKSWRLFSKYLNSFMKKKIFVFIATNNPHFLCFLISNPMSINLIKNTNKIIKIENFEELIKDCIILDNFLKNTKELDFFNYKNKLIYLIEKKDIEKEITFFKKEVLQNLLFSLFSDFVFIKIYEFEIKKSYSSSSTDKENLYKYEVNISKKQAIFLMIFLEKFNKLFYMPKTYKNKFLNIKIYFDFNKSNFL